MRSGLSQNIWVNLCGFQLAWWLAILIGTSAWPLLCLLVLLHLLFHQHPLAEAKVVFVGAFLGFSLDTLLMYVDVFVFADPSLLPPIWLAALWCCFTATLNQGLSWFSNKLIAAAMVGGVAGPLSYLAGEQLGAVSFGQPLWLSMVLLMMTWVLLFPMLMVIATKISSDRPSSAPLP